MKSKITGIKTSGNKTYLRIKVNSSSRKNYHRFKQDIVETFKTQVTGYNGGLTTLMNQDIDINIFKGATYIHIIFYTKQKIRKQILEILFKYFDIMKPK